MKKILMMVLAMAFLIPAKAHAGFAAGMVAGAILFGGDKVGGNADSSVIYALPRASERVKDALDVSMVSISVMGNDKCPPSDFVGAGVSLRNMFALALKKAELDSNEKIILQAIRIIDQEKLNKAVIWFAYTDKNNLIPLEKLKKAKTREKRQDSLPPNF